MAKLWLAVAYAGDARAIARCLHARYAEDC